MRPIQLVDLAKGLCRKSLWDCSRDPLATRPPLLVGFSANSGQSRLYFSRFSGWKLVESVTFLSK